MKNYLYPILIAVLLVSACGPTEEKKETSITQPDRIPVSIMELKKTSADLTIQTSGQFTTDDETPMAFKTGGVIEKILVKEGDAVRSGQVIARLNQTEIEAMVAQARLAVEKATRDLTRASNLYRDSVATLEQYQNARTAADLAQRQFEAASFNRSYSEIRALRNGIVLRKMANEGQVIGPGTPVLVVNGAGHGHWLLKAAVSDREWAFISIGDKADLTSDALPGRTFEGKVIRKSGGSDQVGGTFSLDLQVNDPKGLASGLFGNASITTTRAQQVWEIPYEALLDGDGQTGYVFATDDNKTARKVSVVVGTIARDHLVITAGLEGVNSLIISGSAYLKDGAPIVLK
ncbi:MAG: efflux RND transporter periplasmic adaptor subunit [Bacteroidota bacterium]